MSVSGIRNFYFIFIFLSFFSNVILFCFDDGYANDWLETKEIKFEPRNQTELQHVFLKICNYKKFQILISSLTKQVGSIQPFHRSCYWSIL